MHHATRLSRAKTPGDSGSSFRLSFSDDVLESHPVLTNAINEIAKDFRVNFKNVCMLFLWVAVDLLMRLKVLLSITHPSFIRLKIQHPGLPIEKPFTTSVLYLDPWMSRTSSWFVGLESDLLVVDRACFCCRTLGAALEKSRGNGKRAFWLYLAYAPLGFFFLMMAVRKFIRQRSQK